MGKATKRIVPCKLCDRPTAATNRVCDRHSVTPSETAYLCEAEGCSRTASGAPGAFGERLCAHHWIILGGIETEESLAILLTCALEMLPLAPEMDAPTRAGEGPLSERIAETLGRYIGSTDRRNKIPAGILNALESLDPELARRVDDESRRVPRR